MILRKFRWSRHYESAEEELITILETKHIVAKRWILESFDTTASSKRSYDMTLWCAEGSAVINAGGKNFSLQTGDALVIPADMASETTAGIAGVVCYEASLNTPRNNQ